MFILAGPSAFYVNGLTTMPMDKIQCCWTQHRIPVCLSRPEVVYYWSPFADNFILTDRSVDKYAIPSPERALAECILFIEEYFDEGMLIEGLQMYMDYTKKTIEDLLPVSRQFYLQDELVRYWWKEALESPRT